MDLKSRINELSENMIDDLSRLVRYDSQRAEAKDGMPFGEGPYLALKEALITADRMGFKTVNLDNYCGYAEIGEGKDIIGIAAHLDVVPPGEGWDTDPFELSRSGDTLYGRGVSDDKGAAVASMYALKLIEEEGVTLNKRIRLIFGCNEETGSECMMHYNKVEEPVTYGFTPDGNFPGIHGEKGMLKMTARSKSTKILSMNGGFVSNAVCSRVITKVRQNDVNAEDLRKALERSGLASYSLKEQDGVITIEAIGKAAHASTPKLGINAASLTMKALSQAGINDDFTDYYLSHIGTDCEGSGYNIKLSDRYGDLTLCNGIVRTEDGVIECTIDVRFPVTYSADQIRECLKERLEDEKGVTFIESIEEPLFYPEDSELVKALYSAYAEVTGDNIHKPVVIGGGTYAKYIPGMIAFGCAWPDADNHIHDKNEKLDVNEFKMQTEIYVHAIKNLLAL